MYGRARSVALNPATAEWSRMVAHRPALIGRALARQREIIGLTLFHGNSERDTAGQQIDTQLHAIANAVLTACGADPSLIGDPGTALERVQAHPHFNADVLASREAIDRSPYASLWYDAVSPLLNEWTTFYNDRRHWYQSINEWFTSWEDYTRWFDRVEDLRKQVQAAGLAMHVVPMRGLNTTVTEDVEKGLKDILTLVKWAAIAALGIGGFILIMFAVQGRSLRSLAR